MAHKKKKGGTYQNPNWHKDEKVRMTTRITKIFSCKGGWGRLARVHVGEDPPLDLNKGRLALDHGAGGGASPQVQKKIFHTRIERQGWEAGGWRES